MKSRDFPYSSSSFYLSSTYCFFVFNLPSTASLLTLSTSLLFFTASIHVLTSSSHVFTASLLFFYFSFFLILSSHPPTWSRDYRRMKFSDHRMNLLDVDTKLDHPAQFLFHVDPTVISYIPSVIYLPPQVPLLLLFHLQMVNLRLHLLLIHVS